MLLVVVMEPQIIESLCTVMELAGDSCVRSWLLARAHLHPNVHLLCPQYIKAFIYCGMPLAQGWAASAYLREESSVFRVVARFHDFFSVE